jgi:hypothetical protein
LFDHRRNRPPRKNGSGNKYALDAVKQWRYQPTLLNGQPIATVTTLTIDFTSQPGGVKSAR